MQCKHVSHYHYGTYLCKKCGLLDNYSFGKYEKTIEELEKEKEHMELIRRLEEEALYLPKGPRVLRARKGPGIEHVPWDIRSHYTFLPPSKERKDKVLESYRSSLPLEHREEFQKEFEKDDGEKCAKKKKLIIATCRVACRHSLGFDLDEEVRKLGGKVRIGARDLD